MTAGFWTKSTNGDVLQVDGNYKNLCLRYKTTLTTTSTLGGGAFAGSVTNTANYGSINNAVIALRSSACATVYWQNASNGDFAVAV